MSNFFYKLLDRKLTFLNSFYLCIGCFTFIFIFVRLYFFDSDYGFFFIKRISLSEPVLTGFKIENLRIKRKKKTPSKMENVQTHNNSYQTEVPMQKEMT